MNLEKFKYASLTLKSSTIKFFNRIKKSRPKDLDDVVQEIHENVFEKLDCSTCANCCKTTSPVFYQRDIEKLSKFFRIKPSDFIQKYLHIDQEKDYVLNYAPCPFLSTDNTCMVYENRPVACREYPHTNRKKFYQLLDLTIKNAEICPAVQEIVERLKKVYQH